jgi:hypothetical protein
MDDFEIPPGMSPAAYKAQCNLRHSDKRAYHRYDLGGEVVTGAMQSIQAEIRGEIPLYQVRILRPDVKGKDRTLYAVLVDGEWLPIIYDAATKTPVTILPDTALEPYRHVLGASRATEAVVIDDTLVTARRLLQQMYEDSAIYAGNNKLNSTRGQVRKFLENKKDACVDSV